MKVTHLGVVRQLKEEQKRKGFKGLIATAEDPESLLIGLAKDTFSTLLNGKESRDEWIEKQAPSWLEHGQAYKRIREQRGFSMRKVAKDICISPARLKKFENGLPVYDSKLISRCLQLYYEQEQEG